MALKGSGWGKLSQTVPNHLFGDVNGDVPPPVVHRDGVPDHFRDNDTCPSPGFDDSLLAPLIQFLDLFPEFWVDIWTLLR